MIHGKIKFRYSAGSNSLVSIDLFKNVFLVVESELYSRSVRLMLKRLGCTISRLDEAEVALSDIASIDCGGLPVVFLAESNKPAVPQDEGHSLCFPFTLGALASALRGSDYKPYIDELQNSEKKFPNKRVLLVEDNFINQKIKTVEFYAHSLIHL